MYDGETSQNIKSLIKPVTNGDCTDTCFVTASFPSKRHLLVALWFLDLKGVVPVSISM